MTTYKIQLRVPQHKPSWWGGRILRKITFNTFGDGSPYDLYFTVECGAPVLDFLAFTLSRGLVVNRFGATLLRSWGLSLSFRILDLASLNSILKQFPPFCGITLHTCLQILLTCLVSVRIKIPTCLWHHWDFISPFGHARKCIMSIQVCTLDVLATTKKKPRESEEEEEGEECES